MSLHIELISLRSRLQVLLADLLTDEADEWSHRHALAREIEDVTSQIQEVTARMIYAAARRTVEAASRPSAS